MLLFIVSGKIAHSWNYESFVQMPAIVVPVVMARCSLRVIASHWHVFCSCRRDA